MPVTLPLAAVRKPERDGHRFVIVEQQRRQSCARAELVATGGSRGRVHRISQAAQAVDVTAQSSGVTSSRLREIDSRPVALRLKKRQ